MESPDTLQRISTRKPPTFKLGLAAGYHLENVSGILRRRISIESFGSRVSPVRGLILEFKTATEKVTKAGAEKESAKIANRKFKHN